jgi:fluoride ion exporter CrcB/FEX
MVETLDLLRRNPVQAAAIAIVLAILIAVFAYVAGYLTPHRLSASRIVDAIYDSR